MKKRLVAGTINNWRDEDGWVNVTFDIAERPIYDEATDSFVQPDVIGDLASNLPMFREKMFDEVRCHHVFEHLTFQQAQVAANGIYRVLKRGGVFDIAVPDMDAVCQAWIDGSETKHDLQRWLYGEQLPEHLSGDSHRYGFYEDVLRDLLGAAGFEVREREPPPGLEIRFRAVRTQG